MTGICQCTCIAHPVPCAEQAGETDLLCAECQVVCLEHCAETAARLRDEERSYT